MDYKEFLYTCNPQMQNALVIVTTIIQLKKRDYLRNVRNIAAGTVQPRHRLDNKGT